MSRASRSPTRMSGIAVAGSMRCGSGIHGDKVLRRVGDLAGDEAAAGHARERRTDVDLRTGDAGDQVAAVAGVLAQDQAAACGIGQGSGEVRA